VSATTEDRLTRLQVEAVLLERLPRELLRAASYGHTLSLLGIRVSVEPTYRAVIFYPLLKAVARQVKSNIRAIDLAVRSTDDIVLMLAETPSAGARRLGEKLTEVIDREDYDVGLELPQGVLQLSQATATFPEDGETVEALMSVLKQRLEEASSARCEAAVAATVEPAPATQAPRTPDDERPAASEAV
jgi:diguanylate cyclase (GGDEF)-like protein